MKITVGHSKGIFAHGKCRVIPTKGKYLIQIMTRLTRPDGTHYHLFGGIELVNKDEVSNIKEEEI